jgi:UDP-glucose 4-epimerase
VAVRVLVTGGAGFIGSHIAYLLDGVASVAVLDDLSGGYRRNVPAGVEFFEGSLLDERAVDEAVEGAEVVVHCAAYAAEGLSHWMRRYCYTQNLVTWANLANAVVRHEVRKVVACSSMAVYGAQKPPFDESMPPAPVDPYGAAKNALEADLRALGELHGLEWMIFRPHNVYGPGQNLADPYRNVVAIFMRQALAGEPITVYGDGRQVRAFSYIDDVAQVIARAAVGDYTNRTVNVGGEEPVTILQLAQRVKEVTESRSPIVHLPQRMEVDDAWCEHKMLRTLFGEWHPTDMRAGLAHMAKWAHDLEVGPLRSYDYEVTDNMFDPWRR